MEGLRLSTSPRSSATQEMSSPPGGKRRRSSWVLFYYFSNVSLQWLQTGFLDIFQQALKWESENFYLPYLLLFKKNCAWCLNSSSVLCLDTELRHIGYANYFAVTNSIAGAYLTTHKSWNLGWGVTTLKRVHSKIKLFKNYRFERTTVYMGVIGLTFELGQLLHCHFGYFRSKLEKFHKTSGSDCQSNTPLFKTHNIKENSARMSI